MNHIYRVVFNHQTGTFQAVSEIAKTPHKTGKTKSAKIFKALLTPISLALSLAFGLSAHASPKDGQVTAGVATIHQNGLITDINQTSQNAAINWQSFNIAHNETVNFNQPNAGAVTLNRVIGNEKSVIDGAMNANGKVFISNANGMLIGKDAQINVGSLVATTANISDDDLMNGRYQFTGGQGSIENLGQISVPKGGMVALVAPIVKNGGKITAHEGNVLLASAENFSITLPDNTNFKYTLDKGTLQGLVDNGGAILADGGRVVLTAQGVDTVKKSLIKHTGAIQANTVQNKNGVIELLGDLDNSALTVSGSLKAEAKESGDGGFIETSAAQVKIEDSAEVSTLAQNGKTGTWLIDPKDFTVSATGGDITGAKVSEGLQNNNVTLKSRDGAKEGKGDVIINDEISWDKNTLTLNAENDIHINRTMNGSGTAKLALEYGQGTSDGRDSDYHIKMGSKVNLPSGKTFTTKKGNNGETLNFDVIHQMPDIVKNTDGEWESEFTERNIAFGKDIDVSFTKNYEGFAGWNLPKTTDGRTRVDGRDIRWGRVHGLGHTANNLVLHSSKNRQDTGLFTLNFDLSANRDIVRNLGVLDINVKSNGKESIVGGLAGLAREIHNSYASGRSISYGADSDAGVLVGGARIIKNSYAKGETETHGKESNAGGLAGVSDNIFNSYAEATVKGVGYGSDVGVLAGSAEHIENSYAMGGAMSQGKTGSAGGLAGTLNGKIKNSYFVVNNGGDVIFEGDKGGGLAGSIWENSTISNSFYDRELGLNAFGSITNNKTAHTLDNVAEKTQNQLKQKSTFTGWDFDTVWRIDEGNDMPRLRALTEGTITVAPNPNLPNVNIKAVELRKTYDGVAVNTIDDLKKLRGWNGYGGRLDGIVIQGLQNGDKPADVLTGTVNFDGAKSNWKGAVDAGEYILDPSGLGSQKYEIVWKTGNLTIDPAQVYLMGRKLYDGTNKINANQITSIQGLKDRDLIKDAIIVKSGTGTLTNSKLNLNTAYNLQDVGTLTLGGPRGKNYVIAPPNANPNIQHRIMIVNQKYLDDLKNPNNPGTIIPAPKPPTTNNPTQPTNPSQPTQPTTPTQPTQPNQPTQPSTPVQPNNPSQPTTPTQPAQPSQPTPVQPTIPNQQAQDETQIGVDKEKPKTPKFPDFRDKLPCKSAKECANKGIEWWKRGRDDYNARIEQLLAEDRREEVFYLENPSIKPEDLDSYLKKLDGYSMSSQVIAEEYLSEFPKDLKIFDATFGYETTFYYYLSSVIQMNELSNLSNVYNKELDRFANKYISTDSTTGRKVSEHIERMNWHFDQINSVSTDNSRTYWGWEGTFMDSVHMMSDVLDFGVNAGKVVFSEAAVAMDVSLDVIEKTKNSFTTAVNVTNNTFTTKDIVTDALDIYTEFKKGEDLDPNEVKVKMISIASNLEDALGNGNLGSLKALTDLKDSIENIVKLEKAIDIVNKTPESALPKSIKEQVLDLLESKRSQATTDGAIAVFDFVGGIPALKSNKVVSILKNGAKALNSIQTSYNNSEYMAKSRAYGSKIKSMNSINKHLSNGLRERSRAIKATLR